jgi:chromate transport protein ChrA
VNEVIDSQHTLVAGNGERTLGGLVFYFLKLGSWGFGGPIALAGYMRRDLVEQRGWYTEEEYQQGLAIAQTMPGPLAAQLAMWLGFLERGALGALAVTIPFVVPPFLIVTAVAIVYVRYQGLSQVGDIFFGVGPVVMAIIAIAAWKLARSTNKHDPVLWAVAAIVCAATVIAGAEIAWLFLAAGLFGALYYGGGPSRLGTRLASVLPLPLLASVGGFAWTGTGVSLTTMALFFIEAGAFTFGSGLARPAVELVQDSDVDGRGVDLGQVRLLGVGVAAELLEPHRPRAHLLDDVGDGAALHGSVTHRARDECALFGQPLPSTVGIGAAGGDGRVDEHRHNVRAVPARTPPTIPACRALRRGSRPRRAARGPLRAGSRDRPGRLPSCPHQRAR